MTCARSAGFQPWRLRAKEAEGDASASSPALRRPSRGVTSIFVRGIAVLAFPAGLAGAMAGLGSSGDIFGAASERRDTGRSDHGNKYSASPTSLTSERARISRMLMAGRGRAALVRD